VKIGKFAAVGTVASALVLGGIAGPAFADQTVGGVVNVSTGAVSVPAYSPATIAVNTNATDPTYGGDLDLTVVSNGATYTRQYAVGVDGAGNGSVDLVDQISRAAFNYDAVPAGTYTVTLTSQGETYWDAADQRIEVTGASSIPVTVTVTKLHTKITGWKTKSKSAKHGKKIKLSSPTIRNGGASTKVVLQYKKKGSKTWKTSETGSMPYTVTPKYKLKTSAFNAIKGKIAKRGTYYIRVKVVGTKFVTGDVTKQVKVTWK
jgi:hypothetical protein